MRRRLRYSRPRYCPRCGSPYGQVQEINPFKTNVNVNQNVRVSFGFTRLFSVRYVSYRCEKCGYVEQQPVQ